MELKRSASASSSFHSPGVPAFHSPEMAMRRALPIIYAPSRFVEKLDSDIDARPPVPQDAQVRAGLAHNANDGCIASLDFVLACTRIPCGPRGWHLVPPRGHTQETDEEAQWSPRRTRIPSRWTVILIWMWIPFLIRVHFLLSLFRVIPQSNSLLRCTLHISIYIPFIPPPVNPQPIFFAHRSTANSPSSIAHPLIPVPCERGTWGIYVSAPRSLLSTCTITMIISCLLPYRSGL
ncbi:hypothetical protein C8R44DRAFT_892832 [Mycena epipterygia]|nr:hypothetical protein C8R44DRAFT_892832 [Mycena epipterygia]